MSIRSQAGPRNRSGWFTWHPLALALACALVCGCGPEKKDGAKPGKESEKPAVEQKTPAEEPAAKPEEKPAEEPAAKPEEKPAEEPAAKPEEKPAEEPAMKPEEKPAEEPSAKPEEKPAEEPAAKPEEKPAEKPEMKPEEKPAEEPAAKPEEKPTEEPAAKPEEKPAEKPEMKPEEKPADKPEEKPAAAAADSDPTFIPAVVWLPKPPIDNPAAEAKDEKAMKPYTEEIPNTDVKFEMVPIPGGKFLMGSPETEADRWLLDDNGDPVEKDGKKVSLEDPQHEVEVAPFWMGKCEVTWDEYELWGLGLDKQRRGIKKIEATSQDKLADSITMPTKPYTDMTFGKGKEGCPAICMTQLAAKMYCKWLSAKTGHYYRLPTEAEWEYACRAGTKTAYSFGDDPDAADDFAWYYENSDEKYHKVGEKKPNPWGLYDMHGNVCEWVLDSLDGEFYGSSAGKLMVNPYNAPKKEYGRVVRGGSWDDDPDMLRSAARRGSNKDWKMQDPQIPQSIWYLTDADFVGFRVVRPLTLPSAEEAKKYDAEDDVVKEYKEAQAGKL